MNVAMFVIYPGVLRRSRGNEHCTMMDKIKNHCDFLLSSLIPKTDPIQRIEHQKSFRALNAISSSYRYSRHDFRVVKAPFKLPFAIPHA